MDGRLAAAADELHLAANYAEDVSADVWEFAISIQRLAELGLSEIDLRWLVKRGYVKHAEEVTIKGDDGRIYRPSGNLTFCQRSCFVLTSIGKLEWKPEKDSAVLDAVETCMRSPYIRLVWDQDSRKLFANDAVVKRFRWPAMNQEAVLSVFQEEGWPTRIDDPLPPAAELDPKRRLADTIKCLNRKHETETPLIRFMGDGTGQGVLWESLLS